MTGNSSISITLTDIWYAWVAFRSGKKTSHAILKFEQNLEANLIRLCYDLNTGAYEHQEYSHKIVNEKKRRDIYVASVRDRIVHRLLYDYLVPIVDPKLDFDVWSCRAGKGLHACLARTEKLLAKHPTAWVWRADITKFFDSVPHDVLTDVIDRQITCPKTRDILDKVIHSYASQLDRQTAIGLPIGNLTSQILSNLYMNEFDVFLRNCAKPLAYVRYGDDFIVFCRSKKEVARVKQLCLKKLDYLGLTVNNKQDTTVRSWQELHILGHVIDKNGSTISKKTRSS